jgi:hypothetical protein
MPIIPITSPKIWGSDTRRSCVDVDLALAIGTRRDVSSSSRYEDRVHIPRLQFTGQSLAHHGMEDFVVGLLLRAGGNCQRFMFNRPIVTSHR